MDGIMIMIKKYTNKKNNKTRKGIKLYVIENMIDFWFKLKFCICMWKQMKKKKKKPEIKVVFGIPV